MKQRDWKLLTSAHGRAWLALDDWALKVLGKRWMDSHDHLFSQPHVFYPYSVVLAASDKMQRDYKTDDARRHARRAGRGS